MTASTFTRTTPTQVELDIPIAPEELAAAEERAFRKLVKNVRLPGFRPGHVPRKVFEQTYGADAIRSEAFEDVVPTAYDKAVRDYDLSPVAKPKVEMLPSATGELHLKATVEVRPEIELHDYKGLALEEPDISVSDDDLERSLQTLARERATLVPIDREAKLGDVVTIDYTGTIDGVAFEGGSAEGQPTELDEGRFIPGFATGIAGMRAGESKDVSAAFPADYPKEELAGKTAVFAVTLHDVKELELPALDDAFAQSVSENKTLDDLRADVRTRLEAIAAARARRTRTAAAMDLLMSSHDFELPESMVERELDQLIDEAASETARGGGSFEEALAASGKSLSELREQFRDDARRRVKGTLLIEAIAKAEGISATPEELKRELEALAQQYGQPVDRIQKALGGNVLGLIDGIIRGKTLEFLLEHAIKASK